MTYSITQELASDHIAISQLIDTCFGTDRKDRTVYQFRRDVDAYSNLCLVARDEKGALFGSLRFWPVLLPSGQEIPLFGPLAVNPTLQGRGIGKSLIRAGHDLVKQHNFPAILIIGRPSYYQPFGYSEDLVENLELPGPVAPLTFMGKEFINGSLSNERGLILPAIIEA